MTQTGIINIRGKEYQTVALRVQTFRDSFPDYSLVTDVVERAPECVVMRAAIMDKEGRVLATGHAEEYRASSQINKTSALENAETSAIGRALAAFGFGGTEFATANEVQNAIHQSGAGAEQGQSQSGAVSPAPTDKMNGAINQPHASPRAGSDAWPAGPAKNKVEVRAQWSALKAKILDAVEAGDPDTLDGHLADEKALLAQIEIVEPKWWSGDGLPESIPGFIMSCQAEAHKNESARLSRGPMVGANGQTITDAG